MSSSKTPPENEQQPATANASGDGTTGDAGDDAQAQASQNDEHLKAGKPQQGAFTTGSTMRHVIVMTTTASVGLVAIFAVDLANIFYISLLGQRELAAAIGYAGTFLFFAISVCIGITIGAVARVSRALGAGNRDDARRYAASGLAFILISASLFVAVTLPLLGPILGILGAEGETARLAERFLWVVLPSTPLLGLGMLYAGYLRAVGDAKRAMAVTLSGGVAAAFLDPLLIFGLEMGLDGAAWASFMSRFVIAGVGFYGAVIVNDLVARPSLTDMIADFRPLAAIALPAVLTNVATPVGNAYITAAIAEFGDAAVAGWAIVGRVIPFAFGFIYALSGAVGPIIGQNYGAQQFDRIRATVRDSFLITFAYTLTVWAILALMREPIIAAFGVTGQAADLVRFFCLLVAGSFIFNGMLFVANALFNNLGYPLMSTAFNWGKATLGTIPFVWVGTTMLGAEGALAGQAAGAVVFGVAAALTVWMIITRCERKPPSDPDQPRLSVWRMAFPAFTTGKGATAG